jgi:hypothetical protein
VPLQILERGCRDEMLFRVQPVINHRLRNWYQNDDPIPGKRPSDAVEMPVSMFRAKTNVKHHSGVATGADRLVKKSSVVLAVVRELNHYSLRRRFEPPSRINRRVREDFTQECRALKSEPHMSATR